MEILFITHKYPPIIGGMEKQSYELINGVARQHKVHTLIYDNRMSRARFLVGLPRKVKRMLREHPNISLIHLNDGLMAFIGLIIKRMTDIPVLATIHGLDIVFPSKIFQRVVLEKFNRLDGVIAVSQATAQECIKRGIERDKVYVVRNGVDTDMSMINRQPGFRRVLEKKIGIPLQDKKILVSIGRSVRRKGFSWFMNRVVPHLDRNIVFMIVGPSEPNIHRIQFLLNLLPRRVAHLLVLMLGLGMDEIDIQKALRRPDLAGRAFYLGKQPYEDMVQILKLADMFVMPNIKVEGDAEGFGLVALEASVNGTPVLASAMEGITCAVIDGKNGFLVPPEKEAAWIDKIHALLSDLPHLKTFGEGAKDFTITNYAWKRMVDGYIHVFNKYHCRHEYERSHAMQAVEGGLALDKYIENNA